MAKSKAKRASKKRPKPLPTEADLRVAESQRLIDLYSDRAENILKESQRHERKLGRTSHHAPTGRLCEHLIRNEIRKVLRPGLSADLGFIYGRVIRDGEDHHSPEVDLLIYDETQAKPFDREVDDEVVHVYPKTVRGIVQVKKRLTTTELLDGIDNVACAKDHALRLMMPKTPVHDLDQFPRIYSAVISLTDDLSLKAKRVDIISRFAKPLSKIGKQFPAFVTTDKWGAAISTLPQFVGSFGGYLAWTNPRSQDVLLEANPKQDYVVARASHGGKLLGLQLFLYSLCRFLNTPVGTMPPFAFPEAENFGGILVDAISGKVNRRQPNPKPTNTNQRR